MEHLPRRLNPNAPPFFPSKSHHFRHSYHPIPPPPPPYKHLRRPPPPATVSKRKKFVCSSLTPIPKGPRIKFQGLTLYFPRRSARRPPPAGDKTDNVNRTRLRETTPLNPDDHSTSVMLRNIPNNYTRTLLVEFLENHCKSENEKLADNVVHSAFDFVYLPVDFKHRLNAGYAFVNFTSSEAALRFCASVKGKPWKLFQSRKIADVTRARIQGKEAMVTHFEKMRFCSPSSEYLPVWFDPARDGVVPPSSSSARMRMGMHTIGEVRRRL